MLDEDEQDRKELLDLSTKAWMDVAMNMREVNARVLSGNPKEIEMYLDDSQLQVTLFQFNSALKSYLSG